LLFTIYAKLNVLDGVERASLTLNSLRRGNYVSQNGCDGMVIYASVDIYWDGRYVLAVKKITAKTCSQKPVKTHSHVRALISGDDSRPCSWLVVFFQGAIPLIRPSPEVKSLKSNRSPLGLRF